MNRMRFPLMYTNPVWPGYMADPYVLRWQGEYFAYGTGDRVGDRHFPLLRSSDLCQWELVGGALETPEGFSPDGHYWAPAVAERDGTFYLYYSTGSATDDTVHRLRVAVADHPAGPFRDTGTVLLPNEGFTIDADPFRDPRDGQWYLYFAKDYLDGERPGTGLAVVALGEDMVSVVGEPQTVLRATADWQIYERDRTLYGKFWNAWHTLEGASVIAHEGRYYCFYSGGAWHTPGYGVSYAVADHPLGPWIEATDSEGNTGPLILHNRPDIQTLQGPGHNSIVLGPNDDTLFIVYHAWDAERTARRMCIDPILWTPDGPRCNGPHETEQMIPPPQKM